MLVFNELRIDEKKHLIVDASILNTIESTSIGISNIFIGFGSNEDVTDYWDGTHASAFTRLDVENDLLKGFRLNISLEDNANQLIYVKVAVDDPLNLLDCATPNSIEGYVYDKCLIMEKIFDYVKTTDCCGDITNYANYIVKTMGLEKAIEGGNFNLANKYWQKFFMNNNSILTSNCGCNG